MAHDPFPPLINEYKYTLTRRRVLQTLTGGVRVQAGLPIFLHILQWFLWILPLGLSLPFIISTYFWNVYYLALIGSTLCGLATVIALTAFKIAISQSQDQASIIHANHDDEGSSVNSASVSCITTLSLIFVHRNWVDIIIHTLASVLVTYSSIILLDITVLSRTVSIPATPFIFIAGSIALCTGHYSLIAKPPIEVSMYRQQHQGRFHLFFLRRPVYIILIGIIFVILRTVLDECNHCLIVPYVLFSILPVLWSAGILPPLDSLLFWILEQALIHLMGGSPAPSEIRILIQFMLGFVSTVAIILADDRFILTLLASGLGIILSQNIIQWLLIVLECALMPLARRCCPKISGKYIDIATKNWYTSYYLVDFRIQSLVRIAVSLLVGLAKIVVLLSLTLAITSQTYTRGSDRVLTVYSYIIIVVFVLIEVSRLFGGKAFMCLGLIRNALHPSKIEPLVKLRHKKSLLLCLSLPYQILTIYVGPLVMVAYVSLLLDFSCNEVSSHVWFGITTLRLYRKIWQNSLSCMVDIAIIAALHLALFNDDKCSYWISLGVGNQSIIISFGVYFICNLFRQFKFFIILFVSFVSRCSSSPMLMSILFLPLSLLFIFLSSLFSAPLVPIFTLPIVVMSFPRPKVYWPSLVFPRSLAQTPDSSYYKQALPSVAKCISQGLKMGGYSISDDSTGTVSFLVRFQDRLCLGRVLEKGHQYCLIHIQGLELQETSCHTTEASSIDDVRDTLYSGRRTARSWFNTHPLFNFQPVTVSLGLVYSDARNSLSGIIDSRESLKRFSVNLYKTLVWVFVKYIIDNLMECNGITLASTTSVITSGLELETAASDNDRSTSVISPSNISLKSPRVHPSVSSTPDPILPSTLPLIREDLSTVLTEFPRDWYNHILTSHPTSSIDQTTTNTLHNLIATCYVITDVPTGSHVYKSMVSSKTQPGHVYRRFCGDYSALMGRKASECKKWMQENKMVKELINKSYRYAVKLLYDEAVLGEVADFTELQETLEDYDNSWYIGHEEGNSNEWQTNITSEKRSLFSIGFSENNYTAHVLTLQEEALFLGQLNHSLVEGVWSNLTFELQYLTNDDEERYSIQAQRHMLRNLMTQGADVPYGYKIYSSELVTIPSI